MPEVTFKTENFDPAADIARAWVDKGCINPVQFAQDILETYDRVMAWAVFHSMAPMGVSWEKKQAYLLGAKLL